MKTKLLTIPFLTLSLTSITCTAAESKIVDTHTHIRLGESDAMSDNHPIGIRNLREISRESGIGRSGLIVMNASGNMDETRRKNDLVIAAAASDPEHFYAIGSVHPKDGADALIELERLAKLGVRQIKLHPNSQELDVGSAEVAAVTQKCGELSIVVLFDSYNPLDPSQFGKMLMLTLRQPKTRFVLAHMGFSQFREFAAFALMADMGRPRNVWFDLSATAAFYADSPVEDELVWIIRKIGVDRFLFGSDWPNNSPQEALDALRALGLRRIELDRITTQNAKELLSL